MTQTVIINEWRAQEKLLITQLSGPADIDAVNRWKEELYRTGEKIPGSTPFKMLIDLRGYEVGEIDREVHQIQREVIPKFLAAYKFRVAYLQLFDVPEDMGVPIQSATCVAAAHVHHDCPKMELYDQTLGRSNERFFCKREEAEAWLIDLC